MSSKPWRDSPRYPSQPAKGSAPSGKRRAGPFISTHTLSAPAQRNVVTAAFTLLQVMKITSDKTWRQFIVYFGLDLMLVWILPVLAIPGLNFKKGVILTLTAVFALCDYSLFVNSYWIAVILSLLLRPLEWSLGIHKSPQPLKASGLISGRYVVDILPEATAKMDTISPLCIAQTNTPVYLRLSLNATWPSSVRMSRSELGNTEEYETFEYTKRALAKLPAEPETQTLYLPVSAPGAYYLEGITDELTGLRVRIQRDRIVIPPCPDVSIRKLGGSEVCVGSEFWAEVTASGVPPLNVLIDNNWVTVGAEGSDSDAVLSLDHQVVRHATKVGRVNVEVSKVRDKFGSVLDLTGNSKVATARVIGRPAASASWGRHPLIDSKATAEISVEGDDAPYNLSIDGPDGPFEVALSRSGRHTLRVVQPGTYNLKEVKGKHCSGEAKGSFDVFVPPSVQMHAAFETVEDKCAGPTGMNAHIKLEGTAPFNVLYRSKRGPHVINQRTAKFEDFEGTVQFRPKDAGAYTYEFISVEDRYGKLNLVGDEYRRHQQIAELPGAQFLPISKRVLCGQSQLTVDVLARGKLPLKIKYTIDDKSEYSVTTEDATRIPLNLNFESGTHFVRLLALEDGNGCLTDLHGVRTPDILVRTTIPRASFAEPGIKKSAEPVDMRLPVSIESSTFPANIEFEHELEGIKTRHTVLLSSSKDTIPVSKPGKYRLVGLSDSACDGEVDDSEVSIGLYERPSLHLETEREATSMCHASSLNAQARKVEVRIVGEAPFTILHEIVDPQGHSHVEEVKTRKASVLLGLANDIVGEYSHFLWVMDSRYVDFENSRRDLTFHHRVWAPADATFANQNAKLSMCQGDRLSQSLPVALKGQPPFQLRVQIGKETRVVNATSHSTLDLGQELGEVEQGVGAQQLRILDVTDMHGCRSAPSKHNGLVSLQMLPKPIVHEPKKRDYCIGEKVIFPIKGNSMKYHVDYTWQNKKHRTTTHGAFEKYVNAPGNLSVLSVADDHNCRSPSDAAVEVHPLPSSSITEESHFSIYRGESIGLGFAFKGTAPYSFVYTRTVNGVLQERKEVENVMEDTYSISVEEGGEYEIIELRDKYCRSER